MLTDAQKKEKWERECSIAYFAEEALNDAVGQLVESWPGDPDDILEELRRKFPRGVIGWIEEVGIDAWMQE